MYQTSSAFPTPPRRGAGPSQRPDLHTSNTTGAERWAHFARPPTAPRQQSARDQPDNLNEAWRHVRGSQRPSAASQRAPPPPPPPTQPYSDNETAYARARRSTHTYEGYAAPQPKAAPTPFRSHTVRVPRKNGFDPTAAEGGDEGQARATGYASNLRSSRRGTPAPPEAPEPPPSQQEYRSTPKMETHGFNRMSEDVPFTEGKERVRMPYGGAANMRHSMFESGRQARTRSHERSGSRQRKPSPINATRHRSASPGGRKPQAPTPPRPQPTAVPGRSGNAQRPFVRQSGGDVSDSSGDETIFKGRPMAQPGANRQARRQQQAAPPPPAPEPNAQFAPANGATAQPPPNMYDHPSHFSTPRRSHSLSHQFFPPCSNMSKARYQLNFQRRSSDNTVGAAPGRMLAHQTEIPAWAYPSSVPPPPVHRKTSKPKASGSQYDSSQFDSAKGTWPIRRSFTTPSRCLGVDGPMADAEYFKSRMIPAAATLMMHERQPIYMEPRFEMTTRSPTSYIIIVCERCPA